ncbi:MAG: ParA family protein [Rhodospirillaceae bacterium]|nr:ParA family protein [Rhodospirillaceae bacterium]MBT4489583.1 ParA family protein [Rhodospirillaceae bacterium]MBT5192211.1 ParA family protein [Rhodospirillaceae bacterium]MBT5896789.1 ParA family protein [Rhodospirillaceae bacterium]MBT7757658.1 ParA family protein [Rhodospirillaceae bacterium]
MPQKVISFVTMKGGSGKSTSAMCLAAHWYKAGVRVALVDADPAATLVRWIETGDDLNGLRAAATAPEAVAEQINTLKADGFQRIIIDTPGFRSLATDDAIRQSDLVLVPMRPSPVDFQVAADTVELIDQIVAERATWDGTVRFLMSQTTRGSVIARHMRAQMEAAGYYPLAVELSSRVVYGEAALAGSTPSFYQPRGGATVDIAAFVTEVEGLLSGTPGTGTGIKNRTG